MIGSSRGQRGLLLLLLLAGLFASCTACWNKRHAILARLFGPPPALLTEAYEERADGPRFDHSTFDGLLSRHVDPGGWVDYRGLQTETAVLDGYLDSLAAAPFERLGRNEKLALLINAYNAFTLELILEHYPIAGIRKIPSAQRWDAKRWKVGGAVWSLNQIEHEQIRGRFREPRIHFALVCAAVGCPPLRDEAYLAGRLEDQLEQQTRYVHGQRTWFELDAAAARARLTQLYLWYGDDFVQTHDSVLSFVAGYSVELRQLLDGGATPSIEWLDYDWKLNATENRRPR